MSHSYVDQKPPTLREGEIDGDVTSRGVRRQPSTRSVLGNLRSHRALALVVVLGLAAVGGLLSAWLTPRGPITSGEALFSMGAAFALGLLGGAILCSRWALLVMPAVFVLSFEVARIGVVGPTVDAIHLTSTYGLFAFVLGRGVHGLLVLAPMILGARYGLVLAARTGPRSSLRLGGLGWIMTSLASVALVILAVIVALPPSTAPILGPDGAALAGSVAELTVVPIGGHDQTMMIRGRSTENPVLLYLAGGPGGTDLGAMRADVGLEQDFIVVTWEQRGVGKSYSALDPVSTLTLEQAVSDTIEVTNYLRSRFGQTKVYLVGNSWGTTLGVLAAAQRPDLFHAYVGTGQMVSQRETDIMFYEDTLAWAEAEGDEALEATLRQNGPPPYQNLLAYEPAISHEHDWNRYPYLDTGKEMPFNLLVPENSLMDKVNGFRSFLDTFAVLYPQLQGIDFRTDVSSLEIPVYVTLGQYEARGRAVLAEEWFRSLSAPYKELVLFERSGHRPSFEEPGEFAALMARVLEQTSGSNEAVETVQYQNDVYGFTISFPALFTDLTTARDGDQVIYFVDSDIQQTHPDQPFGVVGRIEIFAKAETSAADLGALGEIYGLRYLAENDGYLFGWAHATDVQLPPSADDSMIQRFRSLEAMFDDSMDSFNLVAATG
jgi:proline iminopeptidase